MALVPDQIPTYRQALTKILARASLSRDPDDQALVALLFGLVADSGLMDRTLPNPESHDIQSKIENWKPAL